MSSRSPDSPQYVTGIAAYLIVSGTVTRGDIPELCADLADRLGRCGVVVCDVRGVVRPDLATVEALARLRLTARRHGSRLLIQGAAPDLIGLLELVGLDETMPRLDDRGPDR